MFVPQEFIRQKRDGKALNRAQLADFAMGIAQDRISDAQIAAFCMAALLKGLSTEETADLTSAMANSGTVLNWRDISPVIDKHSTGGVGDKVSLMLAPIAAACGLHVPMIAGRGLGHTGGTVDKLEAIPGYKTHLPLNDFQTIVHKIGCAIIGQTTEFAPADKRMYAVRDVTATVESIQLITASILSKKLAAGLQGLVLDVKFGNGAFMPDLKQAQTLAHSLKTVSEAAGLPLHPVLTDMNQPLGSSAGNAVEVFETINYLTGNHREERLHDVTLTLAAHMVVLGKRVASLNEARLLAQNVLDSGKAAEIFAHMVASQGGPKDLIENPEKHLPKAPIAVDILADRDGILNHMDTRGIGMVLVNLKAGRSRVEDTIDMRVGLTDIQPLGIKCEKGKTVLAKFHLTEQTSKDIAIQSYLNCLTISEASYTETPVIHAA
jgi:thymidine phosphorylase